MRRVRRPLTPAPAPAPAQLTSGEPAPQPGAPPAASPPPQRGQVEIDFARCTLKGGCAEACPTPALRLENDSRSRRATLTLDLGHCVFCGLCEEACEEGAVRLGSLFELATRRREDLVTRGVFAGTEREPAAPAAPPSAALEATKLRRRALALLGRSLQIRHVDAGSCNGCESELAASAGPPHDLARYGIDFVAAARHADLLLVTGVVTPYLSPALVATWEALPEPKLVVALGACAIGGGIFAGAGPGAPSYGAGTKLEVDVWVPGCPPPPEAILHGLLLAVERIPQRIFAGSFRGAYPASEA